MKPWNFPSNLHLYCQLCFYACIHLSLPSPEIYDRIGAGETINFISYDSCAYHFHHLLFTPFSFSLLHMLYPCGFPRVYLFGWDQCMKENGSYFSSWDCVTLLDVTIHSKSINFLANFAISLFLQSWIVFHFFSYICARFTLSGASGTYCFVPEA